MKHSIFFVFSAFFFLIAGSKVHASGSTIGNGGNVIVCKNQNGEIYSIRLLDLYEAELKGETLKFNQTLTSYEDILLDLFASWQSVAPRRMSQYKEWLSQFPKETGFYSGISIPPTEDTGIIVYPQGCLPEPAAFQRPDSELLPGVLRYTISKDLWDKMSGIDRAGLVLHEFVYREAILASHQTSFPTRYFTGFLASKVPDSATYSSIVSLVRLPWTEYGSGATIQLHNSTKWITIDPNGYLSESANILDVFGNIYTPNMSIEFKTPLHAKDAGVHADENSIGFYCGTTKGRFGSASFKAKRFQIKIAESFESYKVVAEIEKFGMLKVGLYKAQFKQFLNTDPGVTFFQQIDGSLIQGIERLEVSPQDPWISGDQLDYGYRIFTNSGEAWEFDRTKNRYVKK